MKKLVLFVSILTSASIALAQPAHSRRGTPSPSEPDKVRMTPAERLAKLDTNRDGVISKAEAVAARGLAKNFDQIDDNRDGLITGAELAAARDDREKQHMARRAEAFDRIDADKNGTISREEFVKHAPKHGHRGGKGAHGSKGEHGGKRGDSPDATKRAR